MVDLRSMRVRGVGVLIGGVVCAALVSSVVSPTWAAEPGPGDGPAPVVGGFALGDTLEALVDEHDGAMQFSKRLGGLTVTWDSRRAGTDRHGFGYGWGVGLSGIDADGGLRVFPPTGGVYEYDGDHPSGLRGYGGHDLVFRAESGTVPAREGVPEGAGSYAYRLTELGGTTTYFDLAGDPVARVTPHETTTWIWAEGGTHRLLAVIDADGVRTEIDRDSEPDTVVIRTGVNLGTGPVERRIVTTRYGVQLIDPVGETTDIFQDSGGLVTRIDAASGASTEVSWQSTIEGLPRINELRTLDRDGVELSFRAWSALGTATASGWPAVDPALGMVSSGYETVLTDGSTRVLSTYDGRNLLTSRRFEVSTTAGAYVAQEVAFTYPEVKGDRPSELPPQFNRPTSTTTTHSDASGAQRSITENVAFDEFGRMISRTAVDGSLIETTFAPPEPAADPSNPTPEAALPSGLPARQRTTAPDGLVTEVRYELNAEQTAVLAEETHAGPSESELVRTGRTEYTVEPDGFVSAKREFPQGGAGEPVVTERDRSVDLAAGTVTDRVTMAAGTSDAATEITVTGIAHGQVTEQIDAAGVRTSAVFDAAGRPVETIDAAGNTTQVVHETAGTDGRNAAIATGPDDVVMTEERDELGRVVRLTDNLRQGEPVAGHERVIEKRAYDAATVAVTDAWGATTTTTKDMFGRVLSATTPTGLTQLHSYDDVANTKTTALTATGRLADAELITTETLDASGRTTSSTGTRADGVPVATTTTAFDGLGRTVSATNATTTTTIEHNEFGNPVMTSISPLNDADTQAGAEAEAAGLGVLTAERRFDEHGTSQAKTLSTGDESRTGRATTYDVFGRVLTETDQRDRTTSYSYTVDGLPSRVEYADGRVAEHTYDDRTRQLTRSQTTHTDGSVVATAHTYHPITGALTSVYDPADPDHTTIRYTSDGHGNVTEIAYPDGKTIRHSYDEHGRKLATTDVEGNVTTFERTQAGVLTAAVQHSADGAELARVAYTHDELGRVTEIARGNDVITHVSYTSANEISGERTTHDGTPQSERAYSYTEAGLLATRTDTLHHDDSAPTITTTAYGYDHLGRLTASAIHDGADTTAPVRSRTEYTLDVSGNILDETVTVSPDTPEAQATIRRFSVETTGELTAVTTEHPDGTTSTQTQTYDDAGNLTQTVDGTRYEYDALDRPIRETTSAGITVEHAYWADGSRRQLQTTSADGTSRRSTSFYWSDDELVNDVHTADAESEDGTGTASYLMGAGRVARTTVTAGGAVNTVYSTTDRHANVTELTDVSGEVTTRYAYTDYGVTTETPTAGLEPSGCGLTRNPFQYSGEYTDCTGTQYLRARLYLPAIAQFISLDKAPLHNRYAYADANPITKSDPSGHMAADDHTNTLTLVLTIGFAMLTLATAWVTGGASIGLAASVAGLGGIGTTAGAGASALALVSAVGLAADVVGALTAVTLVADKYGLKLIPEHVRKPLEMVEQVAMGVGFVGAIASGTILAKYLDNVRFGPARLATGADNLDGYFEARGTVMSNLRAKYVGDDSLSVRQSFDNLKNEFKALHDGSMGQNPMHWIRNNAENLQAFEKNLMQFRKDGITNAGHDHSKWFWQRWGEQKAIKEMIPKLGKDEQTSAMKEYLRNPFKIPPAPPLPPATRSLATQYRTMPDTEATDVGYLHLIFDN